MLGSSVVPDLLETMNRVVARLIFCSVAFTCAGSVESSMCRRGKPLICPKVLARTSGQRLEPPMPRSRMSLKLSFLISSARHSNWSFFLSFFSVISCQSSHCTSLLFVHSEGSRCQRLGTL